MLAVSVTVLSPTASDGRFTEAFPPSMAITSVSDEDHTIVVSYLPSVGSKKSSAYNSPIDSIAAIALSATASSL